MSSDGILRLDLDLEDAVMPNGAHYANVDGSETSKEKQLVSVTEEEAQPDPDVSPQKKVIKPPMPPIKEAKPSTALEDEPQKNDGSEKKVCKIFLNVVTFVHVFVFGYHGLAIIAIIFEGTNAPIERSKTLCFTC